MAEFKKIMNEYSRICKSILRCEDCPIAAKNNGIGLGCHLFVRESPEEAEHIILQWAEKNPVVTNRRKFKEIFGFALDEEYATPINILDWLNEEYKGDNGDG